MRRSNPAPVGWKPVCPVQATGRQVSGFYGTEIIFNKILYYKLLQVLIDVSELMSHLKGRTIKMEKINSKL